MRYKLGLFLLGFPNGIRGKIEFNQKLNIWDKFRYWAITKIW